MANILDVRKKIAEDIFTYQQLITCLSQYKNKRDRISEFLEREEIIKVKKGLYVFPEELRRRPVNKAIIANLIYGPSYLSCDYGLSYYGLIPERVETLTSVTTGRSCSFNTPFGFFSYRKRDIKNYPIGIRREEVENTGFLIASPEKALYDKVYFDYRYCSMDVEIESYLREDLRIDFDKLTNFDNSILCLLYNISRGKMKKFTEFLMRLNK